MDYFQFSCCRRHDETTYQQPCGCPQATIITTATRRQLRLCGHLEYGDIPSEPPKKYRTKTITVTGGESNGLETKYLCRTPWTMTEQCYVIIDGECYYYSGGECRETQSTFCDGDDYFTTCITGPKYTRSINIVSVTSGYNTLNSTATTKYDIDDCTASYEYENNNQYHPPSGEINDLCESPNGATSLGQGTTFSSEDITPEFPDDSPTEKHIGTARKYTYGPPNTYTHTLSYQIVEDGSGCISRQTYQGAGNQSYEFSQHRHYVLTDEDTEADALARSVPQERPYDNYSKLEIRGASYTANPFEWTIQSAKYAVLITHLMPGRTYQSGGIPLYSREIDQDLQEEPNISIENFTATDTFHIINGTLNVTAKEFKENNYSTNQYRYDSLSDTDRVITPTEPLQEEDGYEFGIGPESYGEEPDLYVEMV